MIRLSELSDIYNEIAIIQAYNEHYESETVRECARSFLRISMLVRGQIINEKPAHSLSSGRKGCIDINVNILETYPEWKKAFVIRHECSHLVKRPDFSPTLQSLTFTYPREMLNKLVSYRRHLLVHKLMIDRWMEDWLREPIRLPDQPGSPRTIFRARRIRDVRDAIFYGITCSVQILFLTYLNEYLLQKSNLPNTEEERLRSDMKRYRGYLDSWWRCLQKEVDRKLLSPFEWFSREHFKNEEIFFSRVNELLDIFRL